jgi:hypothetical protein
MADAKYDKQTQPGASKIKTLRLALGSGASAITQLAAAVTRCTGCRPAGRDCSRAEKISVASFMFPYFPGFPVLAYPGRKPQAPVYPRKSSGL